MVQVGSTVRISKAKITAAMEGSPCNIKALVKVSDSSIKDRVPTPASMDSRDRATAEGHHSLNSKDMKATVRSRWQCCKDKEVEAEEDEAEVEGGEK